MSTHRADVPCIPFDQCPICLAKRKEAREGQSIGQKVEDAFAFLLAKSAPRPEDLAHDPEVQHLFMAERVAWHLSNGCDSPEKARELALKEWRVGVLGEVVP